MAGHLNERPLVNIRKALEGFGLEAAEEVTETEDHISSLCEVMRYLIAGDDVEVSNLTNQRVFSMSMFALGMGNCAMPSKISQRCISTIQLPF